MKLSFYITNLKTIDFIFLRMILRTKKDINNGNERKTLQGDVRYNGRIVMHDSVKT